MLNIHLYKVIPYYHYLQQARKKHIRSEILMGNRFLSKGHSPSYRAYPSDDGWSYASDYPSHPDGTMNICNPHGYLVQTEICIVRPRGYGGYDYPLRASQPRSWSYNSDPPEQDCYSGNQSYEVRPPPTPLGIPVSYRSTTDPQQLPPPLPPTPALGIGSLANPGKPNSGQHLTRDTNLLSKPNNEIEVLVRHLKDAVNLPSSHMTHQPNHKQSVSSKPAEPTMVKPNMGDPTVGTGVMTSREAAKLFNGVLM
ncbi:hypothetical protein SAY87_026994 [Trapa incisa]|uniref:Uncharacterized protein n=1 Tax=Trapa incisa TaxID=236973 RepID=A0AAN7JM70_9MYRT|nr:hypothetical protein SAY87_026994 [Trapa incisa]